MDRLAGYLAALVVGIALLILAVFFGADAFFRLIEGEPAEIASLEAPEQESAALTPTPDVEPEPPQTVPSAPAADAPLPQALRNVTPSGVLPGPSVTAPLTRVPGPPPPKLVELPPRPTRLFLVSVEKAGVVASKGRKVIFNGVAPTPLDRTCLTDDGGSRPCGQQAATALKRFIRNRAIDCVYIEEEGVEAEDRKDPAEAHCTLGKQDISAWLVAGGWAAATETAPDDLKALEDKAREEKRGLWR